MIIAVLPTRSETALPPEAIKIKLSSFAGLRIKLGIL